MGVSLALKFYLLVVVETASESYVFISALKENVEAIARGYV
jgi:hypothetical protein